MKITKKVLVLLSLVLFVMVTFMFNSIPVSAKQIIEECDCGGQSEGYVDGCALHEWLKECSPDHFQPVKACKGTVNLPSVCNCADEVHCD